MEIKSYEFNQDGRGLALSDPMGKDWPVVYLINNAKKLYIGETSSFYTRFGQHLDSKTKKGLKNIHVIYDDEFNKSAVLDIEQYLIRLCGADEKFDLLNGNLGQSSKHNYYQREKYVNKIEGNSGDDGIWAKLKELGLAQNDYKTIVNSDLFSYSPYTSLTTEQEEVCFNVVNDLLSALESPKKKSVSCVIEGSAGTGKTILAIYLMSLLVDINNQQIDVFHEDEAPSNLSLKNKVLHKLKKYIKTHGSLKIAYVLPMTSIRKTLETVFSKTKNGLKANMVVGPADVTEEIYDILIVDESHRLAARRNIGWMGAFDNACRKLGLNPPTTNSLDWIVKQSKHRVLFYDKEQSVKKSDITPYEFDNFLKSSIKKEYRLTTQMRCKGGKKYVDYLSDIFNNIATAKETFVGYEVKLFNSANEMIDAIKCLNDLHGLCRNVAGYSWEWISKGKTTEEIENGNFYDIVLDGKKYAWNMTNSEWILRKESINEIGCIHTTQGYDLNYVGVILGREIDYDFTSNSIIINRELFFDENVKKGASDEELKKYIINSYKVMLTRGIKGCYIYACNAGLRKYLAQFFEQATREE